MVDYRTSISSFDGLGEQLLHTLEKYYSGANDKVHLISYLKQILTTLDPFLKKILFLVDEIEYHEIIRNKSGLGKVIAALDRLDPHENRYRNRAREARIHRFGKAFQAVYSERNIVTHEAQKRGKAEIANLLQNALVIYVYAVFEYHQEITIQVRV